MPAALTDRQVMFVVPVASSWWASDSKLGSAVTSRRTSPNSPEKVSLQIGFAWGFTWLVLAIRYLLDDILDKNRSCKYTLARHKEAQRTSRWTFVMYCVDRDNKSISKNQKIICRIFFATFGCFTNWYLQDKLWQLLYTFACVLCVLFMLCIVHWYHVRRCPNKSFTVL